jgi:ribosomal subunit interface protein
MKITVTGKQIELGDSFRVYAEQKIHSEFEKYFNHALQANVVISHQGPTYRADISVTIGHGLDFQAHGNATEVYPAFELALERTAKQLRREKRKLRDHRRGENHKEPAGDLE